MQIDFSVDGQTVTFRRDWFTGRAELIFCGRVQVLQDPLNLRTHFSLSPVRTLPCEVGRHAVVIEITRPLFFSGIRPQQYRVLVDGQLVASKRGY